MNRILLRSSVLYRPTLLNQSSHRFFAQSAASSSPSTFRTRLSSFVFGIVVSGGIGAYLFYFNFNDTADQINEGINELGVKFKKDTRNLYKEINTLKSRISTLESQIQSNDSKE